MQFILTDIDLTTSAALDVVLQFFEVVDTVVGHTDGFSLAFFLSLD